MVRPPLPARQSSPLGLPPFQGQAQPKAEGDQQQAASDQAQVKQPRQREYTFVVRPVTNGRGRTRRTPKNNLSSAIAVPSQTAVVVGDRIDPIGAQGEIRI
jgi:hypothetical protein